MFKNNKKALIGICVGVIVLIGVLIFGAFKLNLVKLKGDVSERYPFGQEFCLGEECFYVLEDDGTTVKAISKYALYVGNNIIVENGSTTDVEPITPDMEGYGIQNSEINDSTSLKGWIAFSEDNYWENNVDSYPANVFNENSNLWEPARYYETYLRNLGYSNVSVTVPDRETMMQVADSSSTISNDTTYWLGDASDYLHVYCLGGSSMSYIYYSQIMHFKPMITIPREDLKELIKYYFSQEICLKTECFNIIDNDGETLTLISKYNLLVGNNINVENGNVVSSTPISTDTEGYGLQNSNIVGYHGDDGSYTGVIPFVDIDDATMGNPGTYRWYWLDENGDVLDKYARHINLEKYGPDFAGLSDIEYYYIFDEGSSLYDPVMEYKNKLISMTHHNTIDVRLPIYEDVFAIYFHKSKDWFINSNFWLGTLLESKYETLAITDVPNYDLDMYLPNNQTFGIRPVITIDIDDLETEYEDDTTEETTSEEITTSEEVTTSENVTTKEDVTTKKDDKKTTKKNSSKSSIGVITSSNSGNNNSTLNYVNSKEVLSKIHESNKTISVKSSNKVANLGSKISTTKKSATDYLFTILCIISALLMIVFFIQLITMKKKQTN